VPAVQTEEVPFPVYWDSLRGSFSNLVLLKQKESTDFQELLKRTYRDIWTRDRTAHNPERDAVPRGYRVARVFRNENSNIWRRYCLSRAGLLNRASEARTIKADMFPVLDDVKTTVCWREVCPSRSERLAEACNEWYLFHGTSPEAARQICESSFKLNLSGSRTGTLYGKGVYCAESITKADEYAKPNAAGHYAVLLCRVLGGRVRHTEEVAPDPEELLQSCVHGAFDSVVGDREKCKGTFREFVVFDTAAIYPEYVIEYSRLY